MRPAAFLAFVVCSAGCGGRPDPARPATAATPEAAAVARPPAPPFALPANLREPQPVDEEYPLPQGKAKQGALRKARLDFARACTVDVLDRSAGAGAPWAAAARVATEEYAARLARGAFAPPGAAARRFFDALARADAAGCDDPLVRYLKVRFLDPHAAGRNWGTVPPEREVAGLRAVLAELPAMKTPPALKAHLAWNVYVLLRIAADDKKAPVPAADVAAARALFWDSFAAAARDERREARAGLVTLSEIIITDSHLRGPKGREAGWKQIDAALAAAPAPEWTRAAVEGAFLISHAWDARGRGYAETVTGEGWELMRERLGRARDRLDAAWELDPESPQPAAGRIQVEMGLGGGDRGEMELWFRRAMTADPDCYAACSAKREWLQAKWHGSRADAVEFARQCFRTQNWEASLPMILDTPVTGVQLGTLQGARAHAADAELWAGYRAVQRAYLARDPGDSATLSAMARGCSLAGRAAEAAELFDAVGDSPWPGVYLSRDEFTRMRDQAMRSDPAK